VLNHVLLNEDNVLLIIYSDLNDLLL